MARRIAIIGMTAAGTLAALALGAAAFVVSGIYDIGADDHHTKPVLATIELLRERSIAARSGGIEVPNLEDPLKIVAGADRYASLCVDCHLAPGVTKSALRPGLYPHPPNLAQRVAPETRRAFWIVKHGIKMSAMPAWDKSLSDDEIWEVVAFVKKLPEMSEETYQQILAKNPGSANVRPVLGSVNRP